MTKEELEQAKGLCEKASPGPWQACNGYINNFSCIEGISKQNSVEVIVNDELYNGRVGVTTLSNAQFIAASRTLIPKLLDLVEKQQEEIATLKRCLFQMQEVLKEVK